MSTSTHRKSRSKRSAGGRGERLKKRGGTELDQLPWQSLTNPYQAAEVLTEEQLEHIHCASLDILEQQGLVFLLDEARQLLKDAGADVRPDSNLVRLDRNLVLDHVAKAPAQFTLHARNPQHNLTMGGRHLNICSVASAPNCSDLDSGRRSGNHADFQNFIRIGQSLNIMHMFGGYPVEPIDLPPDNRHLQCVYDFLTLSDKAYVIYSLGRQRNIDALEMTRIAYGLTDAEFDQTPCLTTIINANSPLTYDEPMLRGIIEMARRNQVSVITPFTLAGAMAPVTIAGALAQQNAEALAGIAFSQIVRPGAPVIYGGFTSNVDMKSGAPAFGTPEYLLAAQAGGQLARRYALPYRSSNVNAANSVDAQAAYESVFSLWGAVNAHSNMLMHGLGWLEGGLCASFEKMILDADLLQMVSTYLKGIDINEDTLALGAIKEVGSGGHFFGTEHTQARYENAFYAPMLSDWRNFESWEEAGSPRAHQKANVLYKQILQNYTEPPIDPGIKEALTQYIEHRKQQGK